jgi:hypothetical protein
MKPFTFYFFSSRRVKEKNGSSQEKEAMGNDPVASFHQHFPHPVSRVAAYTSFTVMAPVGHTSTQLSHPRHSSMFNGSDFPSFISNTLAGQVSTHSPLPSHLSLSTVT